MGGGAERGDRPGRFIETRTCRTVDSDHRLTGQLRHVSTGLTRRYVEGEQEE
jgi:hypothetical protein